MAKMMSKNNKKY